MYFGSVIRHLIADVVHSMSEGKYKSYYGYYQVVYIFCSISFLCYTRFEDGHLHILVSADLKDHI